MSTTPRKTKIAISMLVVAFILSACSPNAEIESPATPTASATSGPMDMEITAWRAEQICLGVSQLESSVFEDQVLFDPVTFEPRPLGFDATIYPYVYTTSAGTTRYPQENAKADEVVRTISSHCPEQEDHVRSLYAKVSPCTDLADLDIEEAVYESNMPWSDILREATGQEPLLGPDEYQYDLEFSEMEEMEKTANQNLRKIIKYACPKNLKVMDAYDVEVAKKLAAEKKYEDAVEDGRYIEVDGHYLVGDRIQAGTWRTVTKGVITDCYWERASGNGNIIDNHFGNSTRMTVTVHRGEIFTTQDCGEWEKV